MNVGGTKKENKNRGMIDIFNGQIWSSLQEKQEYEVVIVGPTFVRLKATYNPNLVVTLNKERLYEWFSKNLETPAEEAAR